MFVVLLTAALAAVAVNAKEIPTFPTNYIAAGTIELPYAEIVEPYEAFVDGQNDRSRMDTYGGLASVFQLGKSGDYGTMLKVVYETTEKVLNKRACFQTNGTSDGAVHLQSVFPGNPEKYEYMRTESCGIGGIESCDMFRYEFTNGMKTNKYTFTVLTEGIHAIPISFHFIGYDELFGSHYDEYLVTYTKFAIVGEFPEGTFEPEVKECTGYPGPGVTQPCSIFNRLHRMAEHENDEIESSFKEFKDTHGKKYSSDKEHFERSRIYRANHHYVESMNRRKLTYRMKLNHLADLTPVERKMMRGLKRSAESISPPGAQEFQPADASVTIPETHDWRIFGAVTPVKDQAICGSCWSFSTTGVIEGAYFLKHGKPILLSQQNMMDCTWGEGNNACDGGEQFRAYDWIIKHGGIATAESYGPYLMQDGKCHFSNATVGTTITGYVHTKPFNQTDLLMALLEQPIAVNIDASHDSFGFYSSGVYYEPKCGDQPDDLDHAVLAVGYGTLDGEDYWIVKNSWSVHWGNVGFILMSRKDNNCGVATDPSFAKL
ncbi:digestive cysteine proteinase 1-like [Sycon ciliatum]|uniref:digestive cysteine proteinase 1-like n=1 Tax=Sycon ciliatum TaxID=27933 RepID=UPI0020AD13C7|eukprot:scpid63063/ scgid35043/ Counting factor associated protein D